MRALYIITILILSTVNSLAAASPGVLTAARLRCEYRPNPLGIDVVQPRLSWIVESNKMNQKQTAYQVLAASDKALLEQNKPDLWDSGKVISDETIAIIYGGKPLKSNQDCFWKVRVWNADGKVGPWSEPAHWSMGLLNPADWKASWIGLDLPAVDEPRPDTIERARWIWSDKNGNQPQPPQIVYFRKTFDLPADWIIRKASCFIAADDLFRTYLNGRTIRAGRLRNGVFEFALADNLQPGKNTLAVLVENEGREPTPTGFIAGVRIELMDGKVSEILTDDSWLVAKEEQGGWKQAEFDDSGWAHAAEIGPFGMEPWQDTQLQPLVLPPARYLRKEFGFQDKPVKRAWLYATSLGIYQVSVNGQRVSQDYFTPGWIDFRKRAYYRTYDVTDVLRKGDNALGAIIADGWYAGYVGGGLRRNHYGRQVRFLGQLVVEYEDGSTQVIASGPDWKASTGPILHADLLQGETYDARKEMPGWNKPGFDDEAWQAAATGLDEVHPQVQAAVTEPVVVFKKLMPISVTEPEPGKYVFDMGQNFAGVIRLRVQGKAGQVITIRHAERLNPNGTVYTTNLRTAAATDTYICKGNGIEEWTPSFTFHGFQYVELTGLDAMPGKDAILGLAMSSNTPVTGTFECSDAMVNKLASNAYWTQRMNFIDIPTDCPQRDERMGWTGDAQVYISTACLFTDVQSFFTKWLIDLTDAQRDDGQFPRYAPLKVNPSDGGPAWAEAGIICPWTTWHVYGDTRIIEQHYEAMQKFHEFSLKRCNEKLLPPERFHCFGDWLNINDETPHDVIYTAYFGYSTRLLSEMAAAIGRANDAQRYQNLYERICKAFQEAYVTADGRIKGDSQAAYVLAIAYDLLTPDQQKKAAKHLIRRIKECNWHLSTGFVGTKDLMLALAKIGRNDVAYRLLLNDTFPSWGFSIKHGATSIWERWNGWTPKQGFGDPGMNSFAHYSFGAVGQWMFENIGGIQTDGPAYKKIRIKPQPGGNLTWAKVSYDSVRGPITSNWSAENGSLEMQVSIPPNTTAEVWVPAEKSDDVKKPDGVQYLRYESGCAVYSVGSGTYIFKSNSPTTD